MKYVYYFKDNDYYKMGQLDYDKALIKYTNDTPKIEKYRKVKTDAFINNFSIYLNCDCDKNTVLYIPNGSIKQNFVLDAQ